MHSGHVDARDPHGKLAGPHAKLHIIGLGFPRTGTSTLCSALEILGFGPCHHFNLLLRAPPDSEASQELWQPWETAGNAENMTRRAELVLEALAGYRSAADVPVVSFWRELLHAQAIGLLPSTTRLVLPMRTAEEWYSSAEQTILQGWRDGVSPRRGNRSSHARRMGRLAWKPLFGHESFQLPEERGMLIAAYIGQQKEVQQRAAPGSLLLWNPQDGWPGLCGPLGVPTPDVAFPWRNRRGSDVSELLGGAAAFEGVLANPARMVAASFNLSLPVLAIFWCLRRCCRHGPAASSETVVEEDLKED